jgi:hypothetical protein
MALTTTVEAPPGGPTRLAPDAARLTDERSVDGCRR